MKRMRLCFPWSRNALVQLHQFHHPDCCQQLQPTLEAMCSGCRLNVVTTLFLT